MFSRRKADEPPAYYQYCYTKPAKKHPLEYLIFLFVVATAVATMIAACYTRKQWITAKDTEKKSLRAYVTLKETPVLSKTILSTSDPSMRPIFSIWQNGGSTPTTNFTSRVACSSDGPFIFDDPTRTYQKNDKWVLGPHQEFEVLACDIQVRGIADIKAAKVPLFIYGEANYGDIFSPGEAQHITRWCLTEQNISGDPGGLNLNAKNLPCVDKQVGVRYNCTDDECAAP